ncbi:hypothetical protein O181_075852 [Austropuccinia psidii MF-1]|uniref:Uncharacterized protein n=1 Tax=Austropuccinia psidii MF-1 TaxID=1389203 RepID=A0A9Q3FDB8_9BASI|nr:hypothetical protein [Austropuccinia psidii MF-1]
MDLDQEIQVINQKEKNVSPEERHKWRMSELLQVPKATIPFVRPELFQTAKTGDIPVSVQEEVYGGKEVEVETSAKLLDRNNELLSSSEEVHGPRKDSRPFEGLENHFLQRTSPKDKRLVEKAKHFVRGPEERVCQKQGKNPSGSS